MKAKTAIEVFITNDNTTYDFTDGILGIDIVRGLDEYQGIYQAPDVSQLILTSRNELLDPNVTSKVRFNSIIEVYGQKTENTTQSLIFKGYITDINVEYRPQNQPPIITINAVDQIGILQRHKFTSDFKTYLNSTYGNDGVTLTELFTALDNGYYNSTGNAEIKNFSGTTSFMQNNSPGTLTEGRAAIDSGDNAYEFIVQLAQSNLSQIHIDPSGSIYIYPHFKRDPDYFYYPTGYPEGTIVHFKSDGTGSSYKTINIDDGFDRTINQVFVQNADKEYSSGDVIISNSEWGPYNSTTSIDTWNTTGIQLKTYINGASEVINETFSTIANDILQIDGSSTLEAKTISWDALASSTPNPGVDPLYKYNVHIYHEVTNLITIDKYYEVCGIRHSITESDWTITYILKKNKFDIMRQYIPNYSPTISLSPGSGNTNTDFTASISGIASNLISKVRWQLASTYGTENYAPYVFDTPNISNPSNGKIITFDYDAGVNKPYFGAGVKNIRAWIETTTGFTIFANRQITVTAAVPNANFNYSIGQYGDVYFTDTSYDADTWSWNFGDSTTSTLQNPTKTYSTAGTKTVTLTISNGITTSSISKTFTINFIQLIINWVKFQFKGIQTRANNSSPWDKNLVFGVEDVGVLAGPYGNIAWIVPAQVKRIVGTESAVAIGAINNAIISPWTGVSPSPSSPWYLEKWLRLVTTFYDYNGSGNNSCLKFTPVETNGGNTRETDIELYVYIGGNQTFQKTAITNIAANFDTVISYNLINETVFEQNKTYEPVKVFLSENTTSNFATIKNDTTSWVECGQINISGITNTEISNEYFYRLMTPSIPMPPKKTI